MSTVIRLVAVAVFALGACAEQAYFPSKWQWSTRSPGDTGVDAARLGEAVSFIQAHESKNPRDLRRSHDLSFAREAYGEPLGPFQPRGEETGVIVRHGYVISEWGEPERPDMTFSVTKSFLSTVVGLAFDRGLIHDLSDPVRNYVPDPALFGGEHNSGITWDHLLRQTSDWEGTLWSKPDWADRPPAGKPLAENIERKHNPPGSSWKYNDVRVNLLALSTLHVWRQPLPSVLRENIMDPIGASNTWRWYGYENSWVVIDGIRMQSVAGGGHWGGGMIISARDLARFGLLALHEGNWAGKQLLSKNWVRLAKTPTGANPGYGFMNWYLNTGRKLLPSAPESVFCHIGNGANVIYVDPEKDMVAVVRWIDQSALDGFVSRLRAAAH